MLKNPLLNTKTTQTGIGYFQKMIPSLIGLVFVFGSVLFFFMFIWGAVSWILSGGEKGALEAAKGRITNALIGIILLMSTFAVIKFFETFFGINILTIDIGPLIIK